uniref:DUF4283 domain-containing protein n=1 Tax=Noccaea caerulescens TaxID=107243 RepID=A0A1J3CVJ4_NOCCA
MSHGSAKSPSLSVANPEFTAGNGDSSGVLPSQPASEIGAVDGASSEVKADASPDPRWPYLNRWSGSKTSFAATIDKIHRSDPIETPAAVASPVAMISLEKEATALKSNSPSGNVAAPLSQDPASNSPQTNPTTDPLEAPAAVHESPVVPAAVQEASPVVPAIANLPTGIEAPPLQLTEPQLNPPSPPSLACPDPEQAANGDGQSQGNRNPSQPPSLKGAWTKKLKFLPISVPGHSQQTHDQHAASNSGTAEDNVRFPWAAKMNPSSRNLYRAVEPEYLEDGTPKVTIPPHVLLQRLENQKEYVLGQFFRCSPPPGGLIYAVLNNLWGRKCKISIRKLGASSYLFHIPEESTRNWVLQRGLWHVDDCLMFVAPWTPEASLAIPEIKTIPVWVTLKNIPSILYSIRGISHIASGLGAPMATHKPRLDPFFMGEAKILVEVRWN